MTTLYISGPITTDPDHQEHFADAERLLYENGHEWVINPCSLGSIPDATWEDYLRRDLLLVLQHAEGLAMLDGWARSKGARFEREVAERLSIPCKPLRLWLI